MKKYVYLIEAITDLGDISYKIGITKNDPKKRIKQLQTGNSAELILKDCFESEYANKVESTLHRLYSTNNIKGEWFYLEREELEMFQDRCSLLEKNFKIIEEENTWHQSLKNKYY